MSDITATTEPVKKKRRFGCLSILMTLFAIVLLAAAVMIWMAKSEPAELAQVNNAMAQITPQEQLKRADDLEARFVSAMQGIDSSKGPDVNASLDPNRVTEVQLSISTIDANLWLANKMEGWLKNQKTMLPEVLADPRVWIEQEQLVLSSRVKLPVVQGVVSFVIDAKLQEDGKLALKVEKVRTGKLRLPTNVVADQVRDEFKNAQAGFVKTLGEAFDGMKLDPVFPDAGDPKRASRIIKFNITGDRLDMTIRNGPKKIIQENK